MNTFAILPCLALAAASGGDVEIESFDTGDFSNPFFQHALEFDDPCCWEITNCKQLAGGFNCDLHLRPNFDLITLDIRRGARSSR